MCGSAGMRLLFDQNLSHRLAALLTTEYPSSVHVGLSAADDQVFWQFAVQQGLTIVSKDSDFQRKALLYGHPPKVIWVRPRNGSTATIAALLRVRQTDMLAFEADVMASFLVLS
jgi:predicted nuclease of predicted toxin-antitoxin system